MVAPIDVLVLILELVAVSPGVAKGTQRPDLEMGRGSWVVSVDPKCYCRDLGGVGGSCEDRSRGWMEWSH